MSKSYLNLFKSPITRLVGEFEQTQGAFNELEKKVISIEDGIERNRMMFKKLSELMDLPGSDMALRRCDRLFEQVITSGMDLIETGQKRVMLLGAFIELKIESEWKNSGFYKLVYSLLLKSIKGMLSFTSKIEDKILGQLEKKCPETYGLFLEYDRCG